jgi:DedD protein
MGWLFWRSKKLAQPESASTKKRPPAVDPDTGERLDPATQLRIRARRRLIGAAALLLAVAIVVPMVLDDTTRPVADNVPIDIPSEKTPFTPRLSLPPVPEPGNVPLAPPPDAAEPKDDAAGKAPDASKPPAKESKPKAASADKPAEKPADKPGDRTVADVAAQGARKPDSAVAATDGQRARDILEGRTARPVAAAKPARYALQAAAPREEAAALELAERLKKAGYASYVEPVEAKDGTRYRVRVGPFASRDEAERVRARLRALDVNASVVAPGT